MAKKNISAKELEDMPFEKAMSRLEEIVAKMEHGDLMLEEMLKYYEEGNRLSRFCGEKLNSFEKKIELLTKETAQGGEWQEFDPESGRRAPARPETSGTLEEVEEDDEDQPPATNSDLLF